MIGVQVKEKIPHTKIRQQTKVRDAIKTVLKMKWKWAGHIGRMQDERWTAKCTMWMPTGRRRKGAPRRRWRDDIVKYAGKDWIELSRNRDQWRGLAEGYILQWMNLA